MQPARRSACPALLAALALACSTPEAAPPPPPPPIADAPGDIVIVTADPRIRGQRVRTLGGIELPDEVADAERVPGGGLLLVLAGPRPHLALAEDAGHAAEARVLPDTAIETREPVDWQWRIAEDGSAACVRRVVQHWWPHGPPPDTALEIPRVAWIGLVPLDGSPATRFVIDDVDETEVMGWSEGRCVVGVHVFGEDRTLAFDPSRPSEPVVLASGPARARQLSPRGTMLMSYSGFDGDVHHTLVRGEARRELLHDGETRRTAGYAWIGSADVTYAPDDRWLAIRRTEYRPPRFEVSLRVESPDGATLLYEDRWTTPDATERADLPERATFDPPSAAPTGARVQYARVGASGALERAVVELTPDGPRVRILGPAARPDRLHPYVQPLWSPSGDQLVTVDAARRIIRHDVRTGEATDLGELPADTIHWRW